MNDSPHDREARQRRRRIKAFIVMLPFVLLAAGRFWLHVAEQSAISRIRDAGEPVTIDELIAWYFADADEPNAAPIYQRAFDAVVMDDDLSEQVPRFTRMVQMARRGSRLMWPTPISRP